jgi:streptogramin lyase
MDRTSRWRGALATLVAFGAVLGASVASVGTAGAADGDITLFPTANASFEEVAVGPDGNLWFTTGEDNSILRVTPSGTQTVFTDAQSELDNTWGITAGPDGAMWFTNLDNNRIGRIDVTTGDITTFPNAGVTSAITITTGPDGALWFTNIGGSDTIGRVTTAGAFTFFNDDTHMANPKEIQTGPDGALWYLNTSGSSSDSVGRITTAGAVTSFSVGTTTYPSNGLQGARGLALGPAGDWWITGSTNHRIGRMTTSGTFSSFAATGFTAPQDIVRGPDGNMWVSAYGSDEIARITPSQTITTYTAAGLFGPRGMTVGPGGTDVWFALGAGQRVGRVRVGGSGPGFSDVSTSHPFYDDISWMVDQSITTGYPDGTFKPGAAVSRQAMSAFMYRLAGSPPFSDPATPTFGDVGSSNTFYTEIEWMASEQITTGTPASPKPLYKPSAAVTRGAMSAFMYRLAGGPAFVPPTSPTFGDVTTSYAFYGEVEWMASEEITTGTPASPKPLYKPAAAVSRGAMSAFMHRLADGPGVGV